MSIANTQTVAGNASGRAARPTARWPLWTGRVLTALSVLFLLFDAAGKFMMPAPVTQACVRLGIPLNLSPTVGVLLTLSTILYAIPRTAVLGAVLLTGYLGGAVSIQMRAGSSTFETVFPVIFGVLVWAGIYLRDCRLRQVFPIR
ncbi:MAG TPA: DoxX family protein [Terracidiphilus sp.]